MYYILNLIFTFYFDLFFILIAINLRIDNRKRDLSSVNTRALLLK